MSFQVRGYSVSPDDKASANRLDGHADCGSIIPVSTCPWTSSAVLFVKRVLLTSVPEQLRRQQLLPSSAQFLRQKPQQVEKSRYGQQNAAATGQKRARKQLMMSCRAIRPPSESIRGHRFLPQY